MFEEITRLEEEQAQLHLTLADPGFLARDGGDIVRATGRLKELEATLTEKLARWEELESRRR